MGYCQPVILEKTLLTIEHLKSMNVTFVPVASVEDTTGKIVNPTVKRYEGVSKGFAWFQEGDIIFAKITPFTQNGKAEQIMNLSARKHLRPNISRAREGFI
jgi:hypothetical protein